MKRTTSEKELRAWAKSGRPWGELARELGVNQTRLSGALVVLGLGQGPRQKISGEMCTDAVKAMLAGETTEAIAARLNVSARGLALALNARGMPTCTRDALLRQAKSKR